MAMGVRDPVIVAAIATKARLAGARVLAQSLRRHHPELELALLLVDEPQGCFDPAAEPFEVIRLREVAHRDLVEQARSHANPGTAAMSMKAAAIEHLLRRGHERVIYLDTDTIVTNPLTTLIDGLGRADVLLTPHHVEPVTGPDAALWGYYTRVNGALNTGVVAVREGAPARAFLGWWGDRLAEDCDVDIPGGRFLDQRWADLAPGMFEGVAVLADPGTNVAFWNLPQRPLSLRDGSLHAGDVPCRVLHLSGFDPAVPEQLTHHVPERAMRAADAGLAGELAEDYARELRRAGWDECSRWPWAYAPDRATM
ncbi:unannotated protein [freshwater metagenome]|uniref:Unannotated protein n=1 Tax=freshwater metagenome TaxID=449393 RepID=A0A6J7HSM1_9ZZZZ|nr:hypothetical protein [Actinomycetota bacterium]